MKTKILVDFQICINVPLNDCCEMFKQKLLSEYYTIYYLELSKAFYKRLHNTANVYLNSTNIN